MDGMKSELRSFLPAFEKGTELVPELQADVEEVSLALAALVLLRALWKPLE